MIAFWLSSLFPTRRVFNPERARLFIIPVFLSNLCDRKRYKVEFKSQIQNALSNEVNYFYDALNGGFAYQMDNHVIPVSNTKPLINLEAEMSAMTSASILNKHLNIGKNNFSNILYKKSFAKEDEKEKFLALLPLLLVQVVGLERFWQELH